MMEKYLVIDNGGKQYEYDRKRHYLVKANSGMRYWHNFYSMTIEKYKQKFGEKFFLVVAKGFEFYAIPYSLLKHILTIEGLDNRGRWTCEIINDKYRLMGSNEQFDVSEFHNIVSSPAPAESLSPPKRSISKWASAIMLD